MRELKKVVSAPLTELDRLLNEDYVCISVVGKIYGNYARKEEVERIVALGIYQLYYHIKAKDYLACFISYRHKLEKLGIDRIANSLNSHLQNHNKTKIALVGYGTGDEFCFRHILADFLSENGITVTELNNAQIRHQKALWEHDIYKKQKHFDLKDEFVQQILEKWKWINAKTAVNNPHEYTLRKDLNDDELYLKIVSHIRYYGTMNIYEGVVYRTLVLGNYQIWSMPQDIDHKDVDLLNRKLIVQ